jgi:hypothetical protein
VSGVAKNKSLVWGICGSPAGSALRLTEEAVQFAAGRIEEVLVLFRTVVDQWDAVCMNRLAKKSLRSNLSKRRPVVQVADNFSPQNPEIVYGSANDLRRKA